MTDDPVELIADWLPGVPGQDGYFPVMSLATVDGDGAPDVRTVLLSQIISGGMAFHTDSDSLKVQQLRRTPTAALLLHLPDQARQIVVRGLVTEQSEPDLAASYASRTRYLQLLAWLNTPELAGLPEPERRTRWAAFAAEHPAGSLRAPPQWTGFVVVPQRITLWQGHFDGPSHRIDYTASAAGWTSVELPG